MNSARNTRSTNDARSTRIESCESAKATTKPGNSPANVPQNSQNSNKTRKFPHKCSTKQPKQQQNPEIPPQMFHKTAKTTTNAGNFPANVPQNSQNPNELPHKSALPSSIETKADLACVESTPCFQLEQARRSELLSRAKSQRSSRSSAHTNHNLVSKAQSHESALPSSIETKADLACVESTPCFQLEQARRSELLSRAKSQRSSRSSRKLTSRIACYILCALLCSLLAFATCIGPIFRNQDPQFHLGTLADFSWINALIFVLAFAIYAAMLATLIYYGKCGAIPPQYGKFANWIRLHLIRLHLIRKGSKRSKGKEASKDSSKIVSKDSNKGEKASKVASKPNRILLLLSILKPRFSSGFRWFVTHATRNRRNLFLTFLLGWLWAPVTLLAAYGADICSQIREYSWAWNQVTGLKQPYIGFFSFVPMDIYPTAHYLWPAQPTYLTDQHNIVLTVIYGSVAAVSRYFTDSNDAGIVLLALAQCVFAAWCVAATAHRFLNRPWLAATSKQTSKQTLEHNLHTPLFARFAVLLMFLLNPLVVCSTIALTKSPLFAFAFLWWFGVNYELSRSYGTDEANAGKTASPTAPTAPTAPTTSPKARWHTVLELIISVCVMLIAAKYAWYILFAQCVLLVVFDRKRRRLWLSCILVPTLLIHGALVFLISSGAIINGDPIESRGIQLQQIARIAKLDPHSIPRSTKRLIAPIFNLDQTAEAYKPYDADPVKSSGLQSKKVSYRWRYVTRDDIARLNRAWWMMVKHSPLVALDALIAKTYGYFDIFDRPYVGPEYYIDTDNIHNSTWIKYWNPRWRTQFASAISSWSDIPVVSWPIHGNTFVVATLMLGVAEIVLKRWRTLVWHIPLALLVGVMVLAPANNFERHMLPVAFAFGFMLLTFWRDTVSQSRYNSKECED